RTIEGEEKTTTPFTLSPDGKLCATWCPVVTGYSVQVWDVATGKEWRRLTRDWFVKSLAFSPDSKMLAAGDDYGPISLWELQTGKEVLRLEGHQGGVHALAFSPDGKQLASASDDTTVLVWDLASAPADAGKGKDLPKEEQGK